MSLGDRICMYLTRVSARSGTTLTRQFRVTVPLLKAPSFQLSNLNTENLGPLEPDFSTWVARSGETIQQAAERVVAYLARYVRRTAISNDRLIGIENEEVLFWYNDKRDGGKKTIARLPALEFIDRFLQHVLPRGKRHVRNYGYLSPGKRAASLKIIRELFHMETKQEEDDEKERGDEPAQEKDPTPERICPRCEVGVMVSVQQFPRPTVHEIMQMTLDELRQPTLPFT